MRIAILGSGAGAFTFAANFHDMGVEAIVAEYPEYDAFISHVKGQTLKVKGIFNFDFKPQVICNIPAAIAQADFILVVVPAFAQAKYIQDILEHGKDSQYVVFIPGNFAGLYMQDLLKRKKIEKQFHIAETLTLPYATRLTKDNTLNVMAQKRKTRFALVNPENRKIRQELLDLRCHFVEDVSLLQMNIGSPGPAFHASSTILNASRIEQLGSCEQTCGYEMTLSISHVIDQIDKEKKALADIFNLKYTTVIDNLHEMYAPIGKNVYEFFQLSQHHKSLLSPSSLKHRYITQEIPYHFVPLVSLAKEKKLTMPVCESLIHLACALNQENYWQQGEERSHALIRAYK